MDYIISSHSMRAARALLDWTQELLAEKAGLTQATIANLESGKHRPTKTTSDLLRSTFESWGVELLSEGARLVKGIKELTGPDAARRLLEEAYLHLRSSGHELLVFGADEKQHRAGVPEVISKIRAAGIKIRVLKSSGNNFLLSPPNEYRSIPENYFLNNPIVVFGDRVGIFIPNERADLIQIIVNPTLAEAKRRLFEFVWTNASSADCSPQSETKLGALVGA